MKSAMKRGWDGTADLQRVVHGSCLPRSLPALRGLGGYPAALLQSIACFTTCENRYFFPVLRNLNFYKEHFVSKEIMGSPKEKQVSALSWRR